MLASFGITTQNFGESSSSKQQNKTFFLSRDLLFVIGDHFEISRSQVPP